MKKTDLHIKFAKALYKLAEKKHHSAKYFEELGAIKTLCLDKKLVETLAALAWLEMSKIREILSNVFGKSYSEEILNMLALLIANHQLKLIPSIHAVFQKFYFEAEGISDLLICSSRELNDSEQEAMKKQFESSKKNAHIVFSVNKDLIGGVQIYDNGKLTDYSVKNQLEHLRRHLLGEHIV